MAFRTDLRREAPDLALEMCGTQWSNNDQIQSLIHILRTRTDNVLAADNPLKISARIPLLPKSHWTTEADEMLKIDRMTVNHLRIAVLTHVHLLGGDVLAKRTHASVTLPSLADFLAVFYPLLLEQLDVCNGNYLAKFGYLERTCFILSVARHAIATLLQRYRMVRVSHEVDDEDEAASYTAPMQTGEMSNSPPPPPPSIPHTPTPSTPTPSESASTVLSNTQLAAMLQKFQKQTKKDESVTSTPKAPSAGVPTNALNASFTIPPPAPAPISRTGFSSPALPAQPATPATSIHSVVLVDPGSEIYPQDSATPVASLNAAALKALPENLQAAVDRYAKSLDNENNGL